VRSTGGMHFRDHRGTFLPQRPGSVYPRLFKNICSRPFRPRCRSPAPGDRDCVSRA